MRKFICGLLIGFLIALPTTVFGGQALRLVVNGEDITAEAQPIIINGRTLVPARALAEKLGATVSWNAATQTVVVSSLEEPKEEVSLQPVEEEKTYRIGEEFQLGETTIKCTGVSYTDNYAGNSVRADEYYVAVSFDVTTNEEPYEFYHHPAIFVKSITIGDKIIHSNFHVYPNAKIYQGDSKSVTVYRLIPRNVKIDSIQFRNSAWKHFATVIID